MPPLDFSQLINCKIQRTITPGIESVSSIIKNEIVGVNMISHSIVHYKNGAPLTSKIDKYISGENTANTDIVVWYGAHFTHDVSETVDHEVGHILKCSNWPVASKNENIKIHAVAINRARKLFFKSLFSSTILLLY